MTRHVQFRAADVQAQYFAGIQQLMSGRTAIEAPLIDVPGKMIIGNYAMAHAVPGVLRTIDERVSPEELGTRLKRLGVPVASGVPGLPWMYLLGRLQRHLDAGWPEGRIDDDAEAAYVLDWWARVMSSYRNDDRVVPALDHGGWPVLAPSDAAALAERARDRGPIEDIKGARSRDRATRGIHLHAARRRP
jgi:hypothetical protein